MRLENGTPFALERFVDVDRTAAEHLVVVLKGTWSLGEDGRLALADEQPAPRPDDAFHGEPDASSIAQEAELGPVKPGSEVLVTGSAFAPKPGTRAMDVRVAVGKIGRTVRVFGERRWEKKLGFARIPDPEPFEKVALTWENAFGGTDETPKEKHRSADGRNPVGRGFRARGSKLPIHGEPLPNVEDPEEPLKKPGQKPRPAGLAPVCRHWLPRRSYAGTYDEAWQQDVFPFLPADFDERFHHAAPPGLKARGYLQGGEPVELVGLVREGRARFALPDARLTLTVQLRARSERLPFVLETVGFDSDARALRVIWKARLRVHRELLDIRRIACAMEGNADG